MAPSEAELLRSYLLLPAPLPSILPFARFQSFFPARLHSSPQLRSLYRDLQAQRNEAIDHVSRNIDEEVRRGHVMRGQVVGEMRRSLLRGEDGDGLPDRERDGDAEVDMERALFGEASGALKASHTIQSVIPEMENAVQALEGELERLRKEEAELTEELRQTVGGLSDLRYGKLANGKLTEDVMEGLVALREACEGKAP